MSAERPDATVSRPTASTQMEFGIIDLHFAIPVDRVGAL
jgi:hypothetical protein